MYALPHNTDLKCVTGKTITLTHSYLKENKMDLVNNVAVCCVPPKCPNQ